MRCHLKKLFKLGLFVNLMGARFWIGVIVSLILIGVVFFFFWGGSELVEDVNVAAGANRSVRHGSVDENEDVFMMASLLSLEKKLEI